MNPLVIHVGYPKTATTSLQVDFFSRHPDINYLGKFIPTHRYVDENLYELVRDCQTALGLEWAGENRMRELVNTRRKSSKARLTLLSSENFLHPDSADPLIVAERLKSLFPEARIIIGLRRQSSLLFSFYRSHGAFGQYLFLAKEVDVPINLPLRFDEWMEYQFRTPHKNLLGILDYGRIIESYAHLFGRENVCVLVFEQLASEKDIYVRTLSDFLDVDRQKVSSDQIGRHNAGPTLDELASVWQKLGHSASRPEDTRWFEERFRVDRNGLWMKMAEDRFRASNRRAAEVTGLDLAYYGYPT